MKHLNINCQFEVTAYDELAAADREIIDQAKEASQRSYAPYSKFQVGAALRLDDGTVVEGNNQENSASPSSLCAERTAVFFANSRFPDKKITDIAIAAQTGGRFVEHPVPPCGACRQVLLESERRQGTPLRILLYGAGEVYITTGIKNLLPLSFDASFLNL